MTRLTSLAAIVTALMLSAAQADGVRSTDSTLAAVVTALMLSAAQADGIHADAMRSTNCFHGYGTVSCTTKWQRWEPQTPQPPTEQELAEIRDRERIWQARCQPSIRQDEFGVRRYVYAVAGCEFGKLN
jgi:hypothetical protein